MNKEYLEWAENEVELAKKDPWEKGNAKELDCALSLFKQMNEEGLNTAIVFYRLQRLFEHLPLSLITEKDEFEFINDCGDGGKRYMCKRSNSTFKHVTKDGEVTYEDMRYYVEDEIDNEIADSVNTLASHILSDVQAIKLPYNGGNIECPILHIKQGKTFDSDEVDAVYVDYIENLYGENYKVNTYFMLDENNHWHTVFEQEYKNNVRNYMDCEDEDCCGDCDECEFNKYNNEE